MGLVYNMALGSKIRSMRKERKWSAEYLAEKAKCTQSTISDIEAGKRSPQYNTLERIAAAFEVPVIEILPTSARLGPLSEMENRILEFVHGLSTEQRHALLNLLEKYNDDDAVIFEILVQLDTNEKRNLIGLLNSMLNIKK